MAYFRHKNSNKLKASMMEEPVIVNRELLLMLGPLFIEHLKTAKPFYVECDDEHLKKVPLVGGYSIFDILKTKEARVEYDKASTLKLIAAVGADIYIAKAEDGREYTFNLGKLMIEKHNIQILSVEHNTSGVLKVFVSFPLVSRALITAYRNANFFNRVDRNIFNVMVESGQLKRKDLVGICTTYTHINAWCDQDFYKRAVIRDFPDYEVELPIQGEPDYKELYIELSKPRWANVFYNHKDEIQLIQFPPGIKYLKLCGSFSYRTIDDLQPHLGPIMIPHRSNRVFLALMNDGSFRVFPDPIFPESFNSFKISHYANISQILLPPKDQPKLFVGARNLLVSMIGTDTNTSKLVVTVTTANGHVFENRVVIGPGRIPLNLAYTWTRPLGELGNIRKVVLFSADLDDRYIYYATLDDFGTLRFRADVVMEQVSDIVSIAMHGSIPQRLYALKNGDIYVFDLNILLIYHVYPAEDLNMRKHRIYNVGSISEAGSGFIYTDTDAAYYVMPLINGEYHSTIIRLEDSDRIVSLTKHVKYIGSSAYLLQYDDGRDPELLSATYPITRRPLSTLGISDIVDVEFTQEDNPMILWKVML